MQKFTCKLKIFLFHAIYTIAQLKKKDVQGVSDKPYSEILEPAH